MTAPDREPLERLVAREIRRYVTNHREDESPEGLATTIVAALLAGPLAGYINLNAPIPESVRIPVEDDEPGPLAAPARSGDEGLPDEVRDQAREAGMQPRGTAPWSGIDAAATVAYSAGLAAGRADERAAADAELVTAVRLAERATEGYGRLVQAIESLHALCNEFPERVPTMRIRMLTAGLATDGGDDDGA